MSWFVLVKVQVFWKANKIWRKSQFLIFWQLSKCQNKWGTFFKFCCLWLLTTSCPLILHLLVDFPFGIFLWLPYKICTSNFKMLIEDGKIKNPWIWIQTNLFFIKWIEKKVENIIQSKKFELCCFFVLLYVQPHENFKEYIQFSCTFYILKCIHNSIKISEISLNNNDIPW